MIYIALNLGPILAATLAGLLIGLAYRAVAVGPGAPGLLPVAAVAEAWLAAILAGALILAPVKAGGWTVALGTAVIIWVGFVAPALIVTHRARGLAWRAVGGDCAHWLAVMLAQAAVLHAVGLRHP